MTLVHQMSLDDAVAESIPVPQAEAPLTATELLVVTKDLSPQNNGIILTAQNMEILREQEMEVAEQYSSAVLRSVFDAMANNGKITLDQLPFVLVGADIQANAKEIEDAIEEHLPDVDESDALLDFQQVEGLYLQLLNNATDVLPGDALLPQAPQRLNFFQRTWRWYQLRQQQRKLRQTAYEKHMKPTTRLLVLILVTATSISVAVVVFAIVFIWIHSANSVKDHAQRQVQLFKEGVHLFGYQKPFEMYSSNNKRLASLMSMMINELGYEGTKETLQSDLLYGNQLMATLLDGWCKRDSLTHVSTNAMLIKAWLESFIVTHKNITLGVQFVDVMNQKLPEGHEIVISHMNNVTQMPEFYSTLRYANRCRNGVCGLDSSAAIASREALKGNTGSILGNDYRPVPVAAAYTYLPASQLGLVYKIDQSLLRQGFRKPVSSVINEVNQAVAQYTAQSKVQGYTSSRQLVLAGNGIEAGIDILTDVATCNQACLSSVNTSDSVFQKALQQESGVQEANDFDGQVVFEAYGPLPLSGLGLVMKTPKDDFVASVRIGVATALDSLNTKLQGTMEAQLATFTQNVTQTFNSTTNVTTSATTNTVQWLTKFKFSNQCNGQCDSVPGTSQFMYDALEQCTEGIGYGLDYRNENVTAGYSCVPSLELGIVLKLDKEQVINHGIDMATRIATYQNNVRFANSTTEFSVGVKKPGVDVVKTKDDLIRLTPLKFQSDCLNKTCAGRSVRMVRSLNKLTGVMTEPDYRNVEVIGAYSYVNDLDIGVVVKVDNSEAYAGAFLLAWRLAVCSISTVFGSMVILALLTNRLLKAMDKAWEEGKQAVEREKQQFSNVIQSMYPPQVAKRMLAGESNIVYNVATATVFFSDIYEFTTTSNAITPDELIKFMGYTFGVMDTVADYFYIYKVKTIGDAYFGVAGLPGSDSMTGNTTLDMMLFASCCVQIFSNRYIHPEEGSILSTVAKTVVGKKKNAKGLQMIDNAMPGRPAVITYGNPALSGAAGEGPVQQVQCIMRYGVATGPITAGVLQGKTPLFDIWGKTVNLASRMESTGQPGRIQVSEGVHHTIMKVPDQPFSFDIRHKVFCKGFGTINAYFVNSCTKPPPKELLMQMQIKPNLGQFYFENAVPGFRVNSNSKGTPSGSAHGSSSGAQSTRSSVVSGSGVRTGETLV